MVVNTLLTGTVELPGDLVDQLEVLGDVAAVASVSNDADRHLTVVDLKDAKARWDAPLPNGRLVALDDRHVFYVDEDDHLVAHVGYLGRAERRDRTQPDVVAVESDVERAVDRLVVFERRDCRG